MPSRKRKSKLSSKNQPDELQIAPVCRELVSNLSKAAPTLSTEIAALCEEWLTPLHQRLRTGDVPKDQKIFNDPVWGSITLLPAEVLLLDSPLLQRLRGIRQLGMAHYVYPGSGYDRLEHVRGVVEAAQRIISALDNCADRAAISDPVPKRLPSDHEAIRLAALMHDAGHGPLSHATEPVIADRFVQEIDAAREVIYSVFKDVLKVAPAELLSILMILSPSFLKVITHALFPVSEKSKLPLIMIGSILGSDRYISVPYLAGVVSGPIDADKLDYMARDAHHAGLPIGLETIRLLSQLQIVKVTEENAPTKELRKRARGMKKKEYYDLGITRAGLGAYEQMIVGRAILFDRVYYHHKVRSAEAMVRRLIDLSELSINGNFTLQQLFPSFSDETFILALGGTVRTNTLPLAKDYTRKLSNAIIERRLFHRAFAFSSRYLVGLDALDEQERDDTSALLGREMLKVSAEPHLAKQLETDIASRAQKIAEQLGGIYGAAITIESRDVIVDMPPPDRVTVRGQDILVGNPAGDVELPNLYFDPEKWSQAYRSKKHCGFVYCPKEFRSAVNLASKIVFAERLNVVMGEAADRLTKTNKIHDEGVISDLLASQLIDLDAAQRILRKEVRFARFHRDDLRVPLDWTADGDDVPQRLADALNISRPRGFTASQMGTIIRLIESLASFGDMSSLGGTLRGIGIGEEIKLQKELRNHMRSRGIDVAEGSKLGGGETDLIFERQIVIENKIHADTTDHAMEVAAKYEWQARRYSIPISKEVVATVVGYKPISEKGILQTRHSFLIQRLSDRKTVAIRIVLPVGLDVPSSAKAPS